MSKNKYSELYTFQDAFRECEKYHDLHGYDNGLEIFIEQGFECMGHFLKLENGWCPSHEEICGHCVHYLVNVCGTHGDRIKYNKFNNMAGRYSRVSVTAKEKALERKDYRKRNKGYSKTLRQGKVKNRTHQKELKMLRDLGVNILRRGKHNIDNGLYTATVFVEDFSTDITIPIPGYGGTQFKMIGDLKAVKAEIKGIVDDLDGESGSPDLNLLYSLLEEQLFSP